MRTSRHNARAVMARLLNDNAHLPRDARGMRAESSGTEHTLYVYDVIDAYWGVSAKAFAQQVLALGDDATLHLRINSPGGDVFEARAMVTALAQFKGRVVTHIDGLAASAASYLALAADEVRISDGAFLMIHKAWGMVVGNSDDLRETAGLLDKVDESIVADYAKRTGKPADEIAALMAAETWFTAAEAREFGFVDVVDSGERAIENSVRWNVAAYAGAPTALRDAPAAADTPTPTPDTRADADRRLRVIEIEPA